MAVAVRVCDAVQFWESPTFWRVTVLLFKAKQETSRRTLSLPPAFAGFQLGSHRRWDDTFLSNAGLSELDGVTPQKAVSIKIVTVAPCIHWLSTGNRQTVAGFMPSRGRLRRLVGKECVGKMRWRGDCTSLIETRRTSFPGFIMVPFCLKCANPLRINAC